MKLFTGELVLEETMDTMSIGQMFDLFPGCGIDYLIIL